MSRRSRHAILTGDDLPVDDQLGVDARSAADGGGRLRRAGRSRSVRLVGAVVILAAVAGIAYRVLHHEGPFIDRGPVTRRVELDSKGMYFIEPAGPSFITTISAADAFHAVPEQAYPRERGRPEVMFGLLTLQDSPNYIRRPAWIILRRHVEAMSTMEVTPFYADSVDVIDPATGEPLLLTQWSDDRGTIGVGRLADPPARSADLAMRGGKR